MQQQGRPSAGAAGWLRLHTVAAVAVSCMGHLYLVLQRSPLLQLGAWQLLPEAGPQEKTSCCAKAAVPAVSRMRQGRRRQWGRSLRQPPGGMRRSPRGQQGEGGTLLASNPLPTASWPFCEAQQQQWPQGGQALLDQAQAAAERLSDRPHRQERKADPALLLPPWSQDAAALLPAAVLLPLLPLQGRVSASATTPAAPSRAPAACPDPPPAQWTECSR